MTEAVRADSCGHGSNEREDVDGDGEHLGPNGGPAELFEDCGREERGAVAGVDDSQVHDDSYDGSAGAGVIARREDVDRAKNVPSVNFPVCEDAPFGILV